MIFACHDGESGKGAVIILSVSANSNDAAVSVGIAVAFLQCAVRQGFEIVDQGLVVDSHILQKRGTAFKYGITVTAFKDEARVFPVSPVLVLVTLFFSITAS